MEKVGESRTWWVVCRATEIEQLILRHPGNESRAAKSPWEQHRSPELAKLAGRCKLGATEAGNKL
jgi:hypothetical protein